MDSMYDVLLQLPIFQGVSRNKISELIEKMKFHFLKYPDGEKIVTSGEECNHLKFLISGEIRSELITQNEKMRITELIQAPNVIAPDHLFGRDTYFPANLYAVGTVGIMQIEKASVIQMLQEEPIFLINLLNILSRRSQKALESFTALSSNDLTTGILGVESHATKIGRHTHHLQTKRFICFLRCATVGIPVYPR